MKFPISAQLKQPGLPGYCVADETLPPQNFMGRQVVFHEPLHVDASYVYDGESFHVQASVHTVLCSVCAFCAQDFLEPFAFSFQEDFKKDAGPEDDCYPMGSEELDITQAMLDNLFLNLPLQSLCKPDCKGLCPVCGCDLNKVQCACRREAEPQQEKPFAQLGALLNHDKEV